METVQDLFKDETKEKELMDVLENMKSLRNQIKQLEASVSELRSEKERLMEVAISMMGQIGITKVAKEGGSTYSISTSKNFRVPASCRAEQRKWCEENDMKELLTVNHQSWNSAMKEMDEVPEFTEVFEKKTISIRG